MSNGDELPRRVQIKNYSSVSGFEEESWEMMSRLMSSNKINTHIPKPTYTCPNLKCSNTLANLPLFLGKLLRDVVCSLAFDYSKI